MLNDGRYAVLAIFTDVSDASSRANADRNCGLFCSAIATSCSCVHGSSVTANVVVSRTSRSTVTPSCCISRNSSVCTRFSACSSVTRARPTSTCDCLISNPIAAPTSTRASAYRRFCSARASSCPASVTPSCARSTARYCCVTTASSVDPAAAIDASVARRLARSCDGASRLDPVSR